MTQNTLNLLWLFGTIGLATADLFAARNNLSFAMGIIVALAVLFGAWLEKKKWYRILREAGYKI